MARFAELVFAYIDELSAASAAGHTDELATSGRVRQRYLERLTQSLLNGSSADAVEAAAERADWYPPETLTAVVLPDARARGALAQVDERTLQPTEQVPGLERALRPDGPAGADQRGARTGRPAAPPSRAAAPWWDRPGPGSRCGRRTAGRCGCSPWTSPVTPTGPRSTPRSNCPTWSWRPTPRPGPTCGCRSWPPWTTCGRPSAEKLRETLRAWLLHHGRRDEIAAALFVHPQTVRYRMQQLRDVYGDRLEDPDWVLRLTLALA